MKVILSGDFMVKLDSPSRHKEFGSFAISFVETNLIKLYSKVCHDNGNAIFTDDSGYSNDADVDQNGCIEVYFEDYEATFECYNYSLEDYKRASAIAKESASEVRVGIYFYMHDEGQNANYVSEQLSFAPSEISFDCSASAYEMIEAIKASSELKRELLQCEAYSDVKSCFERVGIDACDDKSLFSTLVLDDEFVADPVEAEEQIARYGWGSCLVQFAACGVFEGYDS